MTSILVKAACLTFLETSAQALQGGDVIYCISAKYTFFHYDDVNWTSYDRKPIRFTVKVSGDEKTMAFGGSWDKRRAETLPVSYLSNRFLDAYDEFINLNIDLEAGFTATLSHSKEAFIMAGTCEKF